MKSGAVVGLLVALAGIGFKLLRDCDRRESAAPRDPNQDVVLTPWAAHGLEAALPDTREVSGNYARGAVQAQDPGGPGVRLAWTLGRAPTPQSLEADASEIDDVGFAGRAVDVTVDAWVDLGRLGDGPSRTRAFHSDLGEGAVSLWRCGQRNLRLLTLTASHAVEFHRRVMAGVRCTPDAASEPALLPVAVPERQDLGLVSHDASRLRLRGPGRSSFDVERFAVRADLGSAPSIYDFERELGPLGPDQGTLRTYGSDEHPRFAWLWPSVERPTHAYALLPCPTPPGGALLLSYAPRDVRVTAAELDLIGSFRCAGSKEPPSAPRPWAAVADEACKRGDTATCEGKDLDVFAGEVRHFEMHVPAPDAQP